MTGVRITKDMIKRGFDKYLLRLIDDGNGSIIARLVIQPEILPKEYAHVINSDFSDVCVHKEDGLSSYDYIASESRSLEDIYQEVLNTIGETSDVRLVRMTAEEWDVWYLTLGGKILPIYDGT